MDIESDLIEAYFESNGFLVRQAGKAETITNRKKRGALPTLAIFNPAVLTN